MKNDSETYTPSVPDKLVRAVRAEAALLAVRLASFLEENDEAHVSADYLCSIFGWSDGSLRNYAKKLQVLGIWTRKSGTARTHVSVWKKGANFAAYMTQERVQILQKKGTNFAPKKEIRINNTRTGARDDKRTPYRDKRAEKLPIYRNGDPMLQADMIDSMVKIWHADKLGYVFEKDLQQVLAAGAILLTEKLKQDGKTNDRGAV